MLKYSVAGNSYEDCVLRTSVLVATHFKMPCSVVDLKDITCIPLVWKLMFQILKEVRYYLDVHKGLSCGVK